MPRAIAAGSAPRSPRYSTRMCRTLLMVIAAWAMLTGQATAQSAPLGVGLAAIEITPPLGYRMDGYFAEHLSTGTKDPLKARAIVFDQGPMKTALVVADVIGLTRALTSGGSPVGALTVFALHLDTMGGGTEYSADYPGHLERELRRAFGDGFPT